MALCLVLTTAIPSEAATTVSDNLKAIENQIYDLLESEVLPLLGYGKSSTYPGTKTAFNAASLIEKVNYLEQQNEELKEQINDLKQATEGSDDVDFGTASDWKEIQDICKQGKAKEQFSVGESRTINFAPYMLQNQNVKIVLVDIASDGKSITCMFMEFEEPYQGDIDTILYKNSSARSYLEKMYDSLPRDLKSVIGTTNVVTGYPDRSATGGDNIITQDKLFLPSATEMGMPYGTQNEINSCTTWEYYKNLNSTIRQKRFPSYYGGKLLRTPTSNSSAAEYLMSYYYIDFLGELKQIAYTGSSNVSTYYFPAFTIK